MTERNSLVAAIETTVLTLLTSVHTSLPGRIETYDFSKQRATVKPLIKKKFLDETVLELPILTNVPVVFPRTKQSGITFPLERGDGVLLIFSERSLERWKASGREVEPGDPRKFDLSDGIAIPGLFSFADANLANNDTDLQIHHSGQTVTIKKNGDIDVGSSFLHKLVNDTFMSLFNSHVHSGVTSGAFSSGPPLPIMTTANLTTKVRAE